MSIRPTSNATPPSPDALTRVPAVPAGFSDDETRCWQELARSCIGLGSLSASDLPLLARTAKVAARVDALLANPSAKPADLSALVGLLERLLRTFGLSPMARRGVAPLPGKTRKGDADPLDDM